MFGKVDSQRASEQGTLIEVVEGSLCLLRGGKLDEGRICLVVQNLDSDHVSVDSKQSKQDVRGRAIRVQPTDDQHSGAHATHALHVLVAVAKRSSVRINVRAICRRIGEDAEPHGIHAWELSEA